MPQGLSLLLSLSQNAREAFRDVANEVVGHPIDPHIILYKTILNIIFNLREEFRDVANWVVGHPIDPHVVEVNFLTIIINLDIMNIIMTFRWCTLCWTRTATKTSAPKSSIR